MGKLIIVILILLPFVIAGCQDDNGSGVILSSPLLSVGSSSSGVVDTNQHRCYDNSGTIGCPSSGSAFHGQDAQYQGRQTAYQDNGDGTISDLNTGLMWQKTPGGRGPQNDEIRIYNYARCVR